MALPIRRGLLDADEVGALRGWADEIGRWPAGSHVWGHYAEQTPRGPAICRTENPSACHAGVRALVEGRLRACAAEQVGAGVAAFKDKINYKQPGGAGFRPHQDLLAYPGATRVVSLLVAIDACTVASGCVWVATGVAEPLAVDDRGVVRDDVCHQLEWTPAELRPGDVLCIDGLVPHSSDANRTSRARRVLVVSYAPAADGYTREAYYAARAAAMRDATGRDRRFRISTLADFDGVEVRAEQAPPDRCTHA